MHQLSDIKMSPREDEIFIIGTEGAAIKYPDFEPIEQIPFIKGRSIYYGNDNNQIYYGTFLGMFLYDRATGLNTTIFSTDWGYDQIEKIPNTSYWITVRVVWETRPILLLDPIGKLEQNVRLPLALVQFILLEEGKRAITMCEDGTVRIWDLTKFIPFEPGVEDYFLYELW